MSLHFIKAGLETSIQDGGRFGQMHNGISQSGAMDLVAMQMANWLVSKPLDAPIIEITLIGPKIQFGSAMSIAICGARFDCLINGKKIVNDQVIQVSAGDKLVFGKLRSGIRVYLAFSGELYLDENKLEPVLNSYSTHITANFGGFKGRTFQNNDRIELRHIEKPPFKYIPKEYRLRYSGNYLLRCVPSVESKDFNTAQHELFSSQSYRVTSESNRMGVRLVGDAITFEKAFNITSSGLTQGSIQIPPSGQPIISSVDGQTIGGYPRIANIISADLSILGQLKSGDKVRFITVDKELAKASFVEKQARLEKLFN